MDTREIKGHLKQLRDYATAVLGFDRVNVNLKVNIDNYEITVDLNDTFQSKGGYENRVGQDTMWEAADWERPIEEVVNELYVQMSKCMKREERELRYGLALIGKSLEAAADYRTHAGLEFRASMKAEQEKTMLLLPDRRGQQQSEIHQLEEVSEPVAAPQPVAGPMHSDDIAF